MKRATNLNRLRYKHGETADNYRDALKKFGITYREFNPKTHAQFDEKLIYVAQISGVST